MMGYGQKSLKTSHVWPMFLPPKRSLGNGMAEPATAQETETSAVRNLIVILTGIVFSAIGLTGAVLLGASLGYVVSGGVVSAFRLGMFDFLWLVALISIFVAGVSLILSGVRGTARNLVPGPTLYFLGAALFLIGIYLLLGRDFVVGLFALVIGVAFVWIEYRTELV